MATGTVSLRLLADADLDVAQDIFRDSFRTFLRIPDRMVGDADFVRPRARLFPELALGAELDGELVGSSLWADWGSVHLFGPTTMRPRKWTGGAGKALIDRALQESKKNGVSLQVGFTFAESPRHIDFFIAAGFWPRSLTAIMARAVRRQPPPFPPGCQIFSDLDDAGRQSAIKSWKEVTESIFAGLDLRREVVGAFKLKLGDSLVVFDGSTPVGVALCHLGSGSEAGKDTCYVKFAAVKPGPGADERFKRVLEACEALAARAKTPRVTAGVNGAREKAWKAMLAYGFASTYQGVALTTPGDTLYNHPESWVIDDWR